jgi:hypothetical protein
MIALSVLVLCLFFPYQEQSYIEPIPYEPKISVETVVQHLVNAPEDFAKYYSLQNEITKEHIRSVIRQIEFPEGNKLYFAFRLYQEGRLAEEKELATLLYSLQRNDPHSIAPWCFAYVLLQEDANRILYSDLFTNVIIAKKTNNVEACEMVEETLLHAISISSKDFFRALNSLNNDHLRIVLGFLAQ